MQVLAPTIYDESSRAVAHLLKRNDRTAVILASHLMSQLLPDNAVLVPIPSHRGYATDTLTLAKAIAAIKGSEIADILRGRPRGSLYMSKKAKAPLRASECVLEALHEVHGLPVFIDNVCDTGITMRSAFNAVGRGMGLVFSATHLPLDI